MSYVSKNLDIHTDLAKQSTTFQAVHDYQNSLQTDKYDDFVSCSHFSYNPYMELSYTESTAYLHGFEWVANVIENSVSDGDYYIGQELL